ncbi:MAG: hypothetical protein ACYC64_09255 [Armatimonadota bacterium]
MMSQYTTLHIVPVDSPEWIPSEDFIRETLVHLGATTVWHASGYSVPNYWENDEVDFWDYTVFKKLDWRVDIDKAFDLLNERKPRFASVMFFAQGRIDEITESLMTIPEAIRGYTAVGAISVGIGPFSIPSIQWEYVIGRFCFELKISGNGMPYEYDEYVQAVRDNPEIKKLLSYLEEKSGKRWDVLVSCSY